MKATYSKISFLPLLYFGIFLVPLVVNPWGGVNPYEVAKLSYIVFFLGICAVVWAVFLWTRRNKEPNKEIEVPFNRGLTIVLLLWIASFGISQILSIAPIQSFWGAYQRMMGTFTYSYLGIHFAIMVVLLRIQKLRPILLYLIFAIGLFAAGYGIWQFITYDPHGFGTIFGNRIFSTLGNPNSLGQWLIFSIFAGLAIAHKKAVNKEKLFAGLCAIGVFILASALFLTHNRASMLGIAIGGIVWLILILPNYKKWILASCGVLITLFIITVSLRGRLDTRSLNSRFILWDTARNVISQHAVFGSGLETITERLMPTLPKKMYEYESMNHMPDRSHNEFLDILLTRGVFGAALYLVAVGYLIYCIWKNKLTTGTAKMAASTIIAYMVSMFFGFSLAAHAIVLLALWALLLVETIKWETLKIRRFSVFGRILFSTILILFAYFSFMNGYARLAADVRFEKGISAYIRSDTSALSVFNEAIFLSPHFRYLYESMFIFYQDEAANDPAVIPALIQYALAAENISPHLFYGKFLKAQAEFSAGNFAKAEKSFGRALELAPTWARGWYVWGALEYKQNRMESAAKALSVLKDLAPHYETWIPERQRIFSESNGFYFDGMAMFEQTKSPAR